MARSVMTSALENIRQEHQDLTQVLRALEMIVDAYQNGGTAQERELLALIVYYIQVFPDRMHHPKEEDFLFPALRQRVPALAPVLDQLGAEHAECEAKTGRVAEAVRALEGRGEAVVSALKRAADDYVAFQFRHMRLEEEQVLPAAEAALTAVDWRRIDDAFARNSDPLFGENLSTGFQALRDHIAAMSATVARRSCR